MPKTLLAEVGESKARFRELLDPNLAKWTIAS
jgi:hypothetical protein